MLYDAITQPGVSVQGFVWGAGGAERLAAAPVAADGPGPRLRPRGRSWECPKQLAETSP